MIEKIKLAPINALGVASGFLKENLSYNEYKMIDCRFTEELYRLLYTAKDYYDRDVEIWVTIDFVFKTISADIAMKKGELEDYLKYKNWP